MERRIIHIDMDAFYAQVEQRDNPEYRGRPIIVGGKSESRGVVATASYEARKFGVHSAMPTKQAYKLCPDGIYVRPRFDTYKAVSKKIMDIFLSYTEIVEPLSLDEAYLDITHLVSRERSAQSIALDIQRDIFDVTKLTSSSGISYNRYLAKIASGMNKPAGTTVIHYDNVQDILFGLDIGDFPGVGRVTEEKMKSLDIHTGKDLYEWEEKALVQHFGKKGTSLHQKARGIGTSELKVERIRKSIGKETTFHYDINDDDEILKVIEELSAKVGDKLELQQYAGKVVTVKMKTSDYATHSRQMMANNPIFTEAEIYHYAYSLYHELKDPDVPIRLIGVTVSQLSDRTYRNLTIYDFM
ncbi:DNA polymerase IV [Salinicoccus sp. ID82-1]|uniref:DNA polymerase IV n=1 Tax=Salinicoccus cyprini TaxID=2493691 RepID=A0A558ATN2_9STAP|nr:MULTISPECIES: DNA polymerase IV [Salinicoccus]MCG1010943.1 DNA polymerase IV [Salinicoccus sp. ID82-1]TVT27627.1 DNA polymerase IV [Salinicoccus cyprini]